MNKVVFMSALALWRLHSPTAFNINWIYFFFLLEVKCCWVVGLLAGRSLSQNKSCWKCNLSLKLSYPSVGWVGWSVGLFGRNKSYFLISLLTPISVCWISMAPSGAHVIFPMLNPYIVYILYNSYNYIYFRQQLLDNLTKEIRDRNPTFKKLRSILNKGFCRKSPADSMIYASILYK